MYSLGTIYGIGVTKLLNVFLAIFSILNPISSEIESSIYALKADDSAKEMNSFQIYDTSCQTY